MKCEAPWNQEQIKNLNDYQHCGFCHPFTCLDRHLMVATEEGWVCDQCAEERKTVKQDWCHDWMATGEWKRYLVKHGNKVDRV
jgi:hypothetical protein